MISLTGLNLYALALPVYLGCRTYGIGGEAFWCGNSVTDPLGFNLEVLLPIAFSLLLGGVIDALWRAAFGLFWLVSGGTYFVVLVLNLVFGAWYYSYVLELGVGFFRKTVWWL